MRISDWSSDVCSSDLAEDRQVELGQGTVVCHHQLLDPAAIPVGPDEVNRPRRGAISADPAGEQDPHPVLLGVGGDAGRDPGVEVALLQRVAAPRSVLRSEEHTSELQSLMRISYAVFCLKKKKKTITNTKTEKK